MNHEFAITGPVQVRAKVRASDVVVTESDSAAVTVHLETGRDAAEQGAFAAGTLVELTGDVLLIETRLPRFFSRRRSQIRVAVPAGSSLQVETGSGNLTCTVPVARVAIRTGSGDVHLTDADDVEVTAGSADIRVSTLRTGRVTTGSGDVTVGTATESLTTRTGSGDVEVGYAARLESVSGSGSVAIDRVDGEALARSASGDVEVWRAEAGVLELRSTSGDVTVAAVRGTAVLLDCSTVSGRLESSLEAGGEPTPDERRLELRARTVSGDITVRRA